MELLMEIFLYRTENPQDSNFQFLKDLRVKLNIVILILAKSDSFGNGNLYKMRKNASPLPVYTNREFVESQATKEVVFSHETGFKLQEVTK